MKNYYEAGGPMAAGTGMHTVSEHAGRTKKMVGEP